MPPLLLRKVLAPLINHYFSFSVPLSIMCRPIFPQEMLYSRTKNQCVYVLHSDKKKTKRKVCLKNFHILFNNQSYVWIVISKYDTHLFLKVLYHIFYKLILIILAGKHFPFPSFYEILLLWYPSLFYWLFCIPTHITHFCEVLSLLNKRGWNYGYQ